MDPVRIFACQNCSQLLFFENTKCERCSYQLGYAPDRGVLVTLEGDGEFWHPLDDASRSYRFCSNSSQAACNWLIDAAAEENLCLACRHNRTIPDLAIAENLSRWRELELAKHRLFYTLLKLRLPLATRAEDPAHGLGFDFLADAREGGHAIMTGHNDGIITVALTEADSAVREQRRAAMGETYRTLLGHFRHESGHYFWDRLVLDAGRCEGFRALFGDERADYAAALKAHYEAGPPSDWGERYISAYAAAHPWEDFAETWAHYLHIVDALETASAFGVRIHPKISREEGLHAAIDFDPHAATISVDQLVEAWLPLTFAVNSLNRSLGQPDLYPFVLSPRAIEKLNFVHETVHAPGAAGASLSA